MQVINQVATLVEDKPMFVADGHHRYETACNYRDELAQAAGGSLPEEHPAQYVLSMMVSMDDQLDRATHSSLDRRLCEHDRPATARKSWANTSIAKMLVKVPRMPGRSGSVSRNWMSKASWRCTQQPIRLEH